MTRRRRVLAVVAAALLAASGYYQYWVYTGRVVTVERDRLYRSAALSADRLLGLCRLRHITTVIDLREESPETRAEAETLARAGIARVGLPTGQVPSRETVARFLQVMDMKRHEAVLVHCQHGIGRSGLFSAIYRMEYQGWPRWRAIAETMVLGGFGTFNPDDSKAVFLRSYTPRAPAAIR